MVWTSVIPATDDVELEAQLYVGGAWIGGTSYEWALQAFDSDGNTITAQHTSGSSAMTLIEGGTGKEVGNQTDEGTSGILYIHSPGSTTRNTHIRSESVHENGSTSFFTRAIGYYDATGAVTQMRLQFDSGNISSGEFRLYGVRK